jgi:hypothetical protein
LSCRRLTTKRTKTAKEFYGRVSVSFAFFAVMSVIDLLKTDREAHEDREGPYERSSASFALFAVCR